MTAPLHRLSMHCRCGARGTVESDDAAYAARLFAVMLRLHSGEGHGETDPETCRRARERAFRAGRSAPPARPS